MTHAWPVWDIMMGRERHMVQVGPIHINFMTFDVSFGKEFFIFLQKPCVTRIMSYWQFRGPFILLHGGRTHLWIKKRKTWKKISLADWSSHYIQFIPRCFSYLGQSVSFWDWVWERFLNFVVVERFSVIRNPFHCFL